MTTELQAITNKARSAQTHRFQNLAGLLTPGLLLRSWGQLNKQAKPGVDGITMPDYGDNLLVNIQNLHSDLRSQAYRTSPIQRVLIPKGNGKTRSLGLPTTEDKLVQQAASNILQSIWEPEFEAFSYGYRPNKSAHQAVNSLNLNLRFKSYGYVVEADIKGFFDNIDHDWLIKMLELRIDDKAFIGLIKQWLKSRVRQLDGSYIKPEKGTPQGGVISPVLANIYLHYALDLWFSKKVKPRMTGNCMLIRYADDFVVAFQYKDDADRFYRVLPKRLSKFGLNIAPEKTRLIKFNQFRPGRERHFNFLGFEFYWDQDKNGKSQLRRRTARSKLKQAINEMKDWIRRYRSVKLNKLMPLYKRKLIGYQNYFGLPGNSVSLNLYSRYAFKALFKWLNRRSQRRSYNWVSFSEMLRCYGVHGLRVRKREYLAVDWY